MSEKLTTCLLALMLVVWLPGNVLAAEPVPLATVLATLETPFRQQALASSRITDFSAAFTQLSTIVAISRTQRAEGEVWFRFRNAAGDTMPLPQFRWNYRTPAVQEVVSDGSTLWVYQQENQQVVISDISQVNIDYGDNPLTFFSGLGDLARNFHIDWAQPRQDAEGHYQLLLKPQQESRFFRHIKVVVNADAVAAVQNGNNSRKLSVFPLVATEVEDPQGNLTKILFDNPQWNINLAESHFIFDVPPGVEQVIPEKDMAF